ncbi:MAG: hypothetical protein V4649_02130 [Bacteroidota bacterium]
MEVQHKMTVARILPTTPEETFIEVTFSESARFYKIPKNANPTYIKLLKDAEKSGAAVMVKRAREESDVIVSVKKAP